MSLCFLPIFFIMPKKTALTFNVGAGCILASFAVQLGFKEFFYSEFFCGKKPRNFFAYGFFICMLFCILFATIFNSAIGCLIFLILQFVILIYFISTFFPGGPQGVTEFFKTLGVMIKNACTSCCNKADK